MSIIIIIIIIISSSSESGLGRLACEKVGREQERGDDYAHILGAVTHMPPSAYFETPPPHNFVNFGGPCSLIPSFPHA